jgi:TetR/AcrR family transcriptional regulator, tetracycline repressor protein
VYSWFVAATRSPGQRAGLSHEVVIEAARTLADREGVERLSMRSLAAELGVAPNALYSHVGSKSELIDALIDSLLGGIEAPEGGGWRESLIEIMDASRRLLIEHPGLIPVFLSQPSRGPNALRLGEICFELLAQGGIEGERAVHAFRALLIHSFGFAAYEAPRLSDPDRGARVARSVEFFSSSGNSRIRGAADELARLPDEGEFRLALGWMLDGLLADGRASARAGRPGNG